MSLYTIDFETYYRDDYTLSKLTTEEYVRDPRFEVILVGIKRDDEEPYWVPGEEAAEILAQLELENHAVLAHHAHFDGLILSHHFGIRPRIWFDTLSMARALYGARGGNTLAKLCARHDLIAKGDEVSRARGKRRRDFTDIELQNYGRYCCNDCDRERELFDIFLPHFVRSELKLIDRVVRMFTEPMLEVDGAAMLKYAEEIALDKDTALIRAGIQLPDVMSNVKFAEVLKFLGVDPPTKISPATKLRTWAFAKSDPGMIALQEHPDEIVQYAVAARLKNKTTLAETRARRLAAVADRGPLCVYLNYSGAGQTHRLSGGDKLNFQNNHRGGAVREAIHAPDGHVVVVGDSSNIESRVLDWIAGQEDQVEAYRMYDRGDGPDIYCVTAEKIYGRKIIKARDKQERQMGKVTKLGLGFGMGPPKFVIAVKAQVKVTLEPSTAEDIVKVYRRSHSQVVKFWKRCGEALWCIIKQQYDIAVDMRGVVVTCADGLRLPNGLVIRYPGLQHTKEDGFSYFNGKTRERIYGGKVCENIVQALARIIVMEQCLMVPSKRRFVLSVHDEGVFCVKEKAAERTLWEVLEALRTPLSWCKDLPLNSEGGYHKSYGHAKT